MFSKTKAEGSILGFCFYKEMNSQNGQVAFTPSSNFPGEFIVPDQIQVNPTQW